MSREERPHWVPEPIPVLILAAGVASRFGSDKLLAEVAGQPLLAWTIEAVLECVQQDHAVVLLAAREDMKADLCENAGMPTHVVDHADRGMAWTLRGGLTACPPDVPGAIVVLADDPMAIAALPGVLATARRSPTRIVAVRRDPFVPHPVYLPRADWPTGPIDHGDRGLRDLLNDDCLWIDDEGPVPVDVDTPEDASTLERLLRGST